MPGRTVVRAQYLVGFQGGEHRLLRDGCLAYDGDTIDYVGPDEPRAATTVLDLRDHLVVPGFISGHGHLVASPFDRGAREDSGNPRLAMSGLYELATVLARPVGADLARGAAEASIVELLRSGVTAAVDMTSWPEQSAEAAEHIGIRAFVGPVFQSQEWRTDGRSVTYRELDAAEQRARWRAATDFVSATKKGGLVQAFVAPRHVDTCHPELLREARAFAIDHDTFVEVHAAQSVFEFREILARTGRTPLQLLGDEGLLGPGVVLAHCVFIGGHSWVAYPDVGELGLLAESGCAVAHCPWAFARNGQALESLSRYLRAGVPVALGVDSVPQSMLAEMKVAALVGKLVQRDPRVSTARDVFDAATLGGARALGRDDLGRLAPGCKADFCGFSLTSASMSPMHDPLKALVYSASPRDLSTVVVSGKLIIEDGCFVDFDEAACLAEVRARAPDVWSRFSDYDHSGRALEQVSPPSLPGWVIE